MKILSDEILKTMEDCEDILKLVIDCIGNSSGLDEQQTENIAAVLSKYIFNPINEIKQALELDMCE